MNKLLFILNLIIYSLVSSFVYGNDKYSFQLKVISDDNLIINEVEESIFKNLKNFKNLEINDQKDFRDGEPLIVLYVYGKKHENSNVDKNIYTFSIAHTSNTEFMNLMSEVFGDKTFDDSSDFFLFKKNSYGWESNFFCASSDKSCQIATRSLSCAALRNNLENDASQFIAM